MIFSHKEIGFISCLIFLFAAAGGAIAQNGRDIKFNHITREDGLSQSSGHVIFQDKQGFMWFGTNDGLDKYDGYEMSVYKHDPDDSTSISGNNISTIYEDQRGNFWVGTTGAGLNLLDRATGEFKHYKTDNRHPDLGISDNSITDILETGKGKFWIGTYNGLNFFNRDKQKFVHFFSNPANPESLSSSYINCLYEDKQGNLWIGTRDGLNLWDDMTGTFTRYQHEPDNPGSLSNDDVMNIYEDDRGNLWVGTANGLNRFNRKTGQFRHYLHDAGDARSISGNSIFSILQDSRGVLWIGTENHGLNTFDYDTGKFYSYTHDEDNPSSLSNNGVYSIFEDNNHILFIGTYAGGINYVDRKKPKFEWYKHDPQSDHPLSTNSVTAFLEDRYGNFWVGTDGGGLNRFDRKTGNFYPMLHDPNNKNSLSSNVVLALMDDHKGNIWIGYYHGGISKYNVRTHTFTHYRHVQGDPTSLSSDDVFVLYQDRKDNIWAGTNGGGVCRFNPKTQTFTKYQAEEGVVRDIYEDSRKNFWIATYGGGLKLLDRRKNTIWNFYEGDNGLHSNVVLTIHEDQQHNFWIGTKEAGLNLFDRDSLRFTSYTTDDGLPSNQVKGILEDKHGKLWLSTNNGVSEFNPQTENFHNYGIEDGLQGKEFNTLAYYKDREGYMYFGGINGFNRFNPDSVNLNSFVHPLVFTDFKIFNKSVPVGKDSPLKKQISRARKIVLPYTASVLTFEYASLNFNAIKGVKYAYKLKGFDTNWNYVGNKRTATYTNLDPGEYTLKVKSANSDGIWNDKSTSLDLVIEPPYWQTTWFYLLSGLFVAAIILVVYRLRVRSIKKQNKRLEQEVSKRTDELHEKNEDLKEALKELQDTRSELLDKAHKAGMADLATGVLHNVGNILNSVNISTSMIEETLENSKFPKFKQANKLLDEHSNDLEEFLLHSPKGKKLLNYYKKLEEPLANEQNQLKKHCDRLNEKVKLIIEAIDAQQNFAKVGRINEKVHLEDVVEDTLKLQSGSIERHGLDIRKDFGATPPVIVQKSKIVHILINLIKNAKEAMTDVDRNERWIIIRTSQDETHVYLSVIDNGHGIADDKIKKIFTYGYTTKDDGHGYGLHTCANYMKEMNGNITVESEGIGQGSCFRLGFPKITETDRNRSYEEQT